MIPAASASASSVGLDAESGLAPGESVFGEQEPATAFGRCLRRERRSGTSAERVLLRWVTANVSSGRPRTRRSIQVDTPPIR